MTLSHLIPLLLALAVLGIAALLRPAPAQAYACGTRTRHAAARCLINQARARHGRQPVKLSLRLQRSSRREAVRVAQCGFSHTPCGTPWTASIQGWAAHCRSWSAGEVLGRRYTSARAVVHAWMHSPQHRQILLTRSYDRIGFGAPIWGLGGARREVRVKIPQDTCAWEHCGEPAVEHSGVWGKLSPIFDAEYGRTWAVNEDHPMLQPFEIPLCGKHQRAYERVYAPKPGELSIAPNVGVRGEVTGRWDTERSWH